MMTFTIAAQEQTREQGTSIDGMPVGIGDLIRWTPYGSQRKSPAVMTNKQNKKRASSKRAKKARKLNR